MANTQESVNSNNEIGAILKLLEDGEKTVSSIGEHKDIILVLGITGSGKSTFTHFVSGHDDELVSKQIGLGEYIIGDRNNKIGDSTIKSKTIFPELIIDTENNIAFYDCPGFQETRSTAHEISETYFIKKIVDNTKNVKLVFTVSFPSMREGMDRHGFTLLMENAVKFIKNIKKFEDSIALIVTKVDNLTRPGDEEDDEGEPIPVLVKDNEHIENIVKFIKKAKEDLPKDDKDYHKKVQFIDALLIQTAKQEYKNIGIFRRPNKAGVLSKIKALTKRKPQLREIIFDKIQFSPIEENDFSYTLSDKAEGQIDDLIEKINDNIASQIEKIGQEITEYYQSQENNLNDIEDLRNVAQSGYKSFKTLQMDTTLVEPLDLLTKVHENLSNLKITIGQTNFSNVNNHLEYIKFLKTISNKTVKARTSRLAEKFEGLVNYLNGSRQWYSFLIEFDNILSEYEVLKNISKHQTKINELKDTIVLEKKLIYQNRKNITDKIKLFLNEIGKDSVNSITEEPFDMPIGERKLMFLTKILNSALLSSKDKSLCSEGKLVIRGKDVKLSDIFETECPLSKSIEIFALNNVYIDADLDRTDKQTELSIIAPTWNVIGHPKIILDGKSGDEHKDKSAPVVVGGPGTDGNNGKAGKPGGPTGRFLGIGHRFINGENLSISLKGGDGGPGQNGSDGLEARDGDIMGDPNYEAFQFPDFGHNCHVVDEDSEQVENVIITTQKYKCSIDGKKCTKGGKGGKGGPGGKGGKTSKEKIFVLDDKSRATNIMIDRAEGKVGASGNQGLDQKEGKKGQSMTFDWNIVTTHYILNPIVNNVAFEIVKTNHTDCESMNTAAGVVNIDEPVEPDVVDVPAILNDYKGYARKNLHNNMREKSLRAFLNQLEEDKEVKAEFNILGFVNELQVLEDQFYELRKELPFLPFYESLLKRITEYANKLQSNNELTEDYVKALNYLYAATLSKVISINDRTANTLVLDPQAYFELEANNIEKLKEFTSEALKDDLHKNYDDSIKTKIAEAQAFIDTKITPEFDAITKQIDDRIKELITDTKSRENEAEKEKTKLIDQEKELKHQLLIKTFLGTVQMAGKFLSFAGPVGTAVGVGINAGVGVIEALALTDEETTVPEKLMELPASVKNSFPALKNELENKQKLLKTQLTDAENQLKGITPEKSEPDTEAHIKEVHDKISNLTKEMNQETDVVASYEKINGKKKEILKLLDEKIVLFEKQEKELSTESLKTWVKRLDRASTILSMTQLPIDLYKTISKDSKKIDKMSKAIKEADVKIKQLEQYEDNIYRLVIPKCTFIKNQVENLSHNSKGKSHAALDIGKWEMQSSLKDVKREIKQLTKEYPAQESIAHYIEKLEEAMTVMINMYDLIQDYHDKTELVDYITNINSNQAVEIPISDVTLRRAVDHVKVILHSNLILENYEKGMNSFRQHIYPFANYYLPKFKIPFKNRPSNINTLVSSAAKAMKLLQLDIAESEIKIDKYDHCILNQAFTLEDKSPFFVWNHDENKLAISSLLGGKEVILKSDITKGLIDMNAVKFKEVGINFAIKSANKDLQDELNDALTKFHVTLVHLGNSQYRCVDKFHVITHDNVTINYSLGDKQGDSRKFNTVYGKLNENEPMLSPYAMWTMQLTTSKSNFGFLEKYRNLPIDLALEGIGKYVDNGIIVPMCNLKSVCNDDLRDYYKIDDSVLEVNNAVVSSVKRNSRSHREISSSRKKRQIQQRKRRSLSPNERTQHADADLFATNGAYSSTKSSFINNIFNAVGASLLALEYLNPANKISQWFTKSGKNIDQGDFFNFEKDVAYPSSKFINVESYNSKIPEVSNDFINDESATVNNIVYDSSVCNHGNLLLLDLVIRSKSGVKHEHERIVDTKHRNCEYAQSLAYREHVPL